MSSNAILDKPAVELGNAVALVVEVHQDGNQLFLIIKEYALMDGVANVSSTDVLFMTDTLYPLSAMDMFWTDPGVLKPNGSPFEGSESTNEYLGRQRRRFSYHRNGVWSPLGNPLLDHFAFMEPRWTMRAKP